MRHPIIYTALLTASIHTAANAGSFQCIQIGDADSFGFTDLTSLLSANALPVDTNNDGALRNGEFLPDLNQDGKVATKKGDDFDNRSYRERNNTASNGIGFIDNGSLGSAFTDLSLSTSFDNTFGNSAPFPGDGNPDTRADNQPSFLFDFYVAINAINPNTTLFFNLIYGDYDVKPAAVNFTRLDMSIFTQSIQRQGGNEDGLIQEASTSLAFNDVFTLDAPNNRYRGYLQVDFDAPKEPYTAFDLVELSVSRQIAPPISMPNPTAFGAMAFCLPALLLRRRR